MNSRIIVFLLAGPLISGSAYFCAEARAASPPLGAIADEIKSGQLAYRRHEYALAKDLLSGVLKKLSPASLNKAKGDNSDSWGAGDSWDSNESKNSKESELRGIALFNLALAQRQLGDTAQALKTLSECLKIRQVSLWETHPDLIQTHQELGLLYHQLKNDKEAALHFKKELEGLEKLFGKGSARLQFPLDEICLCYTYQDPEAIPYLEALLQLELDSSRKRSKAIDTAFHLAELKKITGKYVEAERYFKVALELYRKALPQEEFKSGTIPMANVYLNIGYMILRQGKIAEAKPFIDQGLVVMQNSANALDLANRYHWTGVEYMNAKDRANAQKCFEQSLSLLKKSSGPKVSLNMDLACLARVHLESGARELAEKYYTQVSDSMNYKEQAKSPIQSCDVNKLVDWVHSQKLETAD